MTIPFHILIFSPHVLYDAPDQWNSRGEEFCQYGINFVSCRIYFAIASLMYQICLDHLWLILIMCDCKQYTCICIKSKNV